MTQGAPLPRLAGVQGLRRVLIDGGSGAGKTTLARQLQEQWSELAGVEVQLVSLDEVYPGWTGLLAASRAVTATILREVHPGYRRWSWEHGRPAEWVALDPSRPLLVEGCGAITRSSTQLADLCVWVDLDAATRKRLALERDGEGYAPWWDTWAAQEDEHWRRNDPASLAEVVIRRG